MLKEKVDFLNYLHKLVKDNDNNNILVCIQKVKSMGLPVYKDIKDKQFNNIQQLVATIMVAYFDLFLDRVMQHRKDIESLGILRLQLPEDYFRDIPLKTINNWLDDPNNISEQQLLEMTDGNVYLDSNSWLLMNKGFVKKPEFRGQKVYVLIADYGFSSLEESFDDIHLLGVFETKEQAYRKIEEAKLEYESLKVIPTYLNSFAFSDIAWNRFECSFGTDSADTTLFTPLIYKYFS